MGYGDQLLQRIDGKVGAGTRHVGRPRLIPAEPGGTHPNLVRPLYIRLWVITHKQDLGRRYAEARGRGEEDRRFGLPAVA